jgi:hypothetical protein
MSIAFRVVHNASADRCGLCFRLLVHRPCPL